jgi:hypothetical protein
LAVRSARGTAYPEAFTTPCAKASQQPPQPVNAANVGYPVRMAEHEDFCSPDAPRAVGEDVVPTPNPAPVTRLPAHTALGALNTDPINIWPAVITLLRQTVS